MPFYSFKVWRGKTEGGGRGLLYTYPYAPLSEADSYRCAEAHLRELRRAADPRGGYYLRLIYGDDETDAEARLSGIV